jgi:hypothetical protein
VNSLRRKPEEEIKISKIEEEDRNRIIDQVKSIKGQDNILTPDPGDSHWMIPTPHHLSRDNKVRPGFLNYSDQPNRYENRRPSYERRN